jgi:DNA end-binding protein Ku
MAGPAGLVLRSRPAEMCDGNMPKTIARLPILWGLVSIPVTVHAAVEPHAVPLHQVHAPCGGGRIRLSRYCEREGIEVPYEEVTRGYEAPDGRVVVLSDADLADLPMPAARSIEVLAFVDADRIDPLTLDKGYFLGSGEAFAARPYALLRDAMREAGQVAVARVTLHTRESLAVLRPRDDVIAMQTMLWPDELRTTEDITVPKTLPARRQELQMARSLMAAISAGFRLEEQHDDYGRALKQLVTARLEGTEPPHAPETVPVQGTPVDLMTALERSIEAAQARRTRPMKAAAKKTPRRRSAG